MQERALAHDAMRVGSFAADQQGRRSNGAGRYDEGRRAHGDLARGRIGASRIQTETMKRRRATVDVLDGPGASARDEARASRQRGWNGRYQHRLLGIRRAAHAAIAEIPAAPDVAAYLSAGNAEHARATAQRLIVFVGGSEPRRDA